MSLFVLAVALLLSGCFGATAGVAIGIAELADRDDDDRTPAELRVFDVDVVPNPEHAGRATDVREVKLTFSLATPEPADVTLEFSTEDDAGKFRAAAEVEGTTQGVTTGEHELVWDASADGLNGLFEVVLRITPYVNGVSGTAGTTTASVGNRAPEVVDIEFPDGDEVSGNVVITYELKDSSGDASFVEFFISCDDGDSFTAICPAGSPPSSTASSCGDAGCSAALERQRSNLLPGVHDLTWNSLATLGGTDIDGLIVGILPYDLFSDGRGELTTSRPIRVRNNSPPRVFLVEPSLNRDSHGPMELRFFLEDEEGDTADVVFQWSTERDLFPPILDLKDPGLRRAALRDPDVRALRQMLTPRLRTILEARLRVADGHHCDFTGESTSRHVTLTGITPPTAITGTRLKSATLELLSDAGAVEEAREIVAVDPRSRCLLVDTEFNRPLRQGHRIRVRESLPRLFIDLASSKGQGVEHTLAWDTPVDVGLGEGDGSYYILATPFGGERVGLSFTSTVAKEISTDRLTFAPGSVRAAAGRPQQIAAADLDGDGHLDLVSLEKSPSQLSILIGQGDGTLEALPPLALKGERGPLSLTTGDVNRDGHLDLVVAEDDRASDWLSIYLGRGDGAFREHDASPLLTANVLVSAVAADLDCDGNLDLVSAHTTPNQLSVHWGNGDGTFVAGPVVTKTSMGNPASLATVDVDGDGHLDLVSAEISPGQLSVFLGQQDGTFVEHPESPVPAGSASLPFAAPDPSALTTADLNGDGHVDLILAEKSPDRLAIFLGRGDGSFSASQLSALRPGALPHAVTAVDLNGDGHLDLVSADAISDQLSVFLGRGDGRFLEPQPEPLSTGDRPVSVAVGDFNGDGHPDLVSGNQDSADLSVYLGRGDVVFRERQPPPLPIDGLRQSVTAADFNGDGHADLVSRKSLSSSISIYLGSGDADFPEPPPPAVLAEGLVSAVSVADVNGDGYLDLAAAMWSPDQLSIFLGNNDGTFHESQPPIGTDGTALALMVADLNGDGHLDLVPATGPIDGSGRLSIFLGSEDGTFSGPQPQSLTTGIRPAAVTAGDLNGDGHVDLVSADSEPAQLSIFLSNGDGTFREPRPAPLALADRPASVTAGDFDGDGRLDLVAAVPGVDRLAILLGNGDGTFVESQPLTPEDGPLSVLAADLNGDGPLDLVSADANSGHLSLFLGRGDATFVKFSPIETEDGPLSVTAADFNGDGSLDLASVHSSGHLSIFLSELRSPEPASFFGIARVESPTVGKPVEEDDALLLEAGHHTVNTSSGAVDGVPPRAFRRRAFHFDSITIEAGAEVRVSGENPLVLLAKGEVTIDGALICDGMAGEDASSTPGWNHGARGGRGGPGGAPGGDGGGVLPGSGNVHGNRGGGSGGGKGGGMFLSGAGGSYATRGEDGSLRADDGATYGNDLLRPLYGGSGGGGGSVRDGAFGADGVLNPGDPEGEGGDFGGGGGGGGGGAVRITAGGDIVVRGRISADGGNGGRGNGGRGGHGGGGSGGSILLEAYGQIFVESAGGTLSASGGKGASGEPEPPECGPTVEESEDRGEAGEPSPRGGDGGEGRILLESLMM